MPASEGEGHEHEQAKLLPCESTDVEAGGPARRLCRSSAAVELARRLCAKRLPAAVLGLAVVFVLAPWSRVPEFLPAGLAAKMGLASESCHDAELGEACFESIAWARWHGIYALPGSYLPCDADTNCSSADLQAVLHQRMPRHCPRPCAMVNINVADVPSTLAATLPPATTTSTTLWPTTTTPAATTAGSAVMPAASVAGATGVCRDAVAGTYCHNSVMWARTYGIWSHADWYPHLTVQSPPEAFQEELHRTGQGNCSQPCKPVDLDRELEIRKAKGPLGDRQLLQFYVYRAQSTEEYPLENVNVADLAGVMWYLHNEIIPSRGTDQRKYNITRLMRYKITTKTTWEFFHVHKRQFASFVAFDNGKCTVPDCDRIWEHYGYIPGCQFQDMGIAAYTAGNPTRVDGNCAGAQCNSSLWYSLPGPCPGRNYSGKTEDCRRNEMGGLCNAATGARDCTYSVEHAGEIQLDELSGIKDYREFKLAGKQEYIGHLDTGIGMSFWDGKADLGKCAQRMERVKFLFNMKYPDLPNCDALGEPPCDFDGYYQDEFDWPILHGEQPNMLTIPVQ